MTLGVLFPYVDPFRVNERCKNSKRYIKREMRHYKIRKSVLFNSVNEKINNINIQYKCINRSQFAQKSLR